jgi:hypothetical protein
LSTSLLLHNVNRTRHLIVQINTEATTAKHPENQPRNLL